MNSTPKMPVDETLRSLAQSDLNRVDNAQQTNRVESNGRSIAPTVKEMVYMRFGCTAPKDKVESNLTDLPHTILVKKLLGNPDITIADETEWENIRIFLAHCKEAYSLADIPPALFDFHQKDSKLYSEWTIQVRRELLSDLTEDQVRYYVISESGQQQQPGRKLGRLYLLLSSATDVLEIVRQGWGPSLRDVMQKLLSRGIAFRTCYRAEYSTGHRYLTARQTPRYSGLGYRRKNFTPNLSDYQLYVAIRRSFLRSPRGRVALLYGVSPEEVLREPSGDDALIDRICLWDGHSTSGYWVDHLKEEEIDLICGVYHVSTGQVDIHGPQTSTLSWWPRPPAFNASGINVGWWTPMWETWYKRRLQQLESGNGILATHTEWKSNIQLQRKAPPYTEAVEKCAANILAVLRP
ncbi:hypothetical protein C8R44DRAFT_791488 [Mycena epipterygia]|nr:hypothetical protein C8R44DRAFT_791488 [Mycena epipterygia]